MKRTRRFLTIAALVLMGGVMADCTGGDLVDEQPESKSKTVTLTTTVSMDGATTKALTSTGVKTFAEGDMIAVVYKNNGGMTVSTESEVLTAEDISGPGDNLNKIATFTVTLDGPEPDTPVRYIYPAHMCNSSVLGTHTIGVTDDATINYAELKNHQIGTLDNLAWNFDLAIFDGRMTSDAKLPASATLENQLAILAITLLDSGGNDITETIKDITVSDGDNEYSILPNYSATTFTAPIYVAIRPTDEANITVTALTEGTKRYSKILTGKTYAASNGYDVSWRMEAWESNEYKEGAWDGSKVVFTKKTATNPTVLTSSDSGVNLEGGWYTVTGDNVVINGQVNFTGETHLILCDGAKLTVNGRINVDGYSYIYGQGAGTGKLIVSSDGYNIAVNCKVRLYIHGGDISATSSSNIALNLENSFIMFGGTLAATNISGSNAIYCHKNIDLYGGKIVASNDSHLYAAISLYSDSDPLTVYGGQLLAHNNGGAAIKGNIMSGLEGILFYFTYTESDWGEGYYIPSLSPVTRDDTYIKAE